jgi:hypothetical protein
MSGSMLPVWLVACPSVDGAQIDGVCTRLQAHHWQVQVIEDVQSSIMGARSPVAVVLCGDVPSSQHSILPGGADYA